ncbi:ABC-F family ATP-binding cassette domain-containing protein [Intestinibacter bartlettii]|uniref:ABC-F family ATP-binding cassette domain-containing protein n=1 Tax=Intestinibacter bartlettii TaxID=261299 RepID=A0ABS8CTY2_9FIRM|nr:ABC-F family ATP-binding cassette domain-containing protein [Intestinibacter bartlettii]MCB5396116.1 ABC-F family ATP-binding cassette domain-containing protein [Intestinibacter bartlettii]MCB5402665.1 ABC-F family ATP-binding cassette domain-containing protein [Intestinibacter bartlettii]MCB5444921.1 ABC-F family ATP-binding cassette domain-containing protein [Intestinibacter bartlettii]MCB5719528.1 ABC-F family ATP-binding cassette domain-containing protein [Intestinibacter bartlettii]MCB
MNLITLENISKSYSEKKLLEDISLGINDKEKIGLIGVNGTGKSTLLKIIAGAQIPDDGTITKANKVRIEYLPQNPYYDENATVLEQVFKGTCEEMKIIGDYQDVLDKINKSYDEKLNDRLLKLQEKMDALNLWDLESSAKTVLTKLGIKDFNQKVKELSGGQRKRVSLASALITPCELLILDEPTNHLDNDTIDWLETYLNSFKGSILMITHDRYFLDRVTNRILELDKGILYSYEGNYSVFLEKKMNRLQLAESMEAKRQNLLRKELAWVRRGAKARTTKQKARLQRFDELSNKNDYTPEDKLEISVGSSRLGKKIIEIENLSKSFDGRTFIDNLDYTLARTDRIGIVGRNGLGKSTLIRLLNGELKPDSGTISIGETVKIGCFNQDTSKMHPEMRAIDYIKEESDYITTADGHKITASQMCEKFLFNGTLQYTHIKNLSGGEKRRLQLLRVLMMAPNVLLLDEPTNDLDIDTLSRLEDYLDDFNGVLICVSHDRYFLDRVCNKIFAYEGRGKINIYTGNYSDYLDYREQENIEFEEFEDKVKEEKPKAPKKEKPKTKNKPKFSYNEQREFDTIDEDIEKLEDKIASLEEDTSKYATDFTKLQEIMDEKTKLENELQVKYERWEYLNNLAEEIANWSNN